MTPISDQNIDLNRLKQAVSALYEHFDAVQIFVTRCSDNGCDTVHCNYGAGNWFSRFGHIKSFVNDVEKGYILGDAVKLQNKDDKPEWEK
jgi:hypothetical protein